MVAGSTLGGYEGLGGCEGCEGYEGYLNGIRPTGSLKSQHSRGSLLILIQAPSTLPRQNNYSHHAFAAQPPSLYGKDELIRGKALPEVE